MRTCRPEKASVLALAAAAIFALPSLASAALFVPSPRDCHYFNTGISLDLRTSSIPSVPEPASLVLLGSGLALAHRFRRIRTRQ